MANKKSKYSFQQRRAYYSGMGYSVAYAGNKVEFSSQDLKDAFMAGYKAGNKKQRSNPSKYPKNSKK